MRWSIGGGDQVKWIGFEVFFFFFYLPAVCVGGRGGVVVEREVGPINFGTILL